MKKMVFIGGISQDGKVIGGETLKNQYFIDYLRRTNIDFDLIDVAGWRTRRVKVLLRLVKVCLSRDTSIIILSTGSYGAYLFLKLLCLLKVKNKKIHYFVIGGMLPERIEKGLFRKKYFKDYVHIYVETFSMKEKLEEMGFENVQRVPNFKTFIFNPPKEKTYSLPLKCVFFSRVVPEKGVDLIIDAVKKLNNGKTKVIVDFYGPIEDSYKPEFMRKISKSYALNYKGVLNPLFEDTYGILSDYDLMLFPTLFWNEGIPGTIIDAYIAGLPVLVNRWKNVSDIITDNTTGIIVENIDSAKLCQAMTDILTQKNGILQNLRINIMKERNKHQSEFILGSVITNVIK